MKVTVMIVDTISGIYQSGQIDEPVKDDNAVANALAHFGVSFGSIVWDHKTETMGIGTVTGTTKAVSYVRINKENN